MYVLVGGGVVLLTTAGVFWYCLPRNGQYHRFCGTELEPYIAVAFTGAFALGFTMALAAAIDLWGK
jgi:hypothetical protein